MVIGVLFHEPYEKSIGSLDPIILPRFYTDVVTIFMIFDIVVFFSDFLFE